MALLRPDDRWWRFPIKGPRQINLDYRWRKTALYPVYTFTEAERRAYKLQPHRGHYGRPFTLKTRPGVLFRGHRLTADRFEACWEAWSWQTSGHAAAHITGVDKWDVRTLIGYGERAIITSAKTFTYDRPLIKTTKPKLRMRGPFTVCGEALKIVAVERIAPDHGIQTVLDPELKSKRSRVPSSFRYCWLGMLPWWPDKKSFDAFFRAQSVHRTARVIPRIAELRRFCGRKAIHPHIVETNCRRGG